jgi:hypothetical protein
MNWKKSTVHPAGEALVILKPLTFVCFVGFVGATAVFRLDVQEPLQTDREFRQVLTRAVKLRRG